MEDSQNRGSKGFDSRELYERDDDDDLDDFIIDDDEGEGRVSRKERIRQRKEKLDTAANRGFNYGVSDE